MPFNKDKEKEIIRYSGYLNHSQAEKLERYVIAKGISKAKVLAQLLDQISEEELSYQGDKKYVTEDKLSNEIKGVKEWVVSELSKVINLKNDGGKSLEIKELSKVNKSYESDKGISPSTIKMVKLTKRSRSVSEEFLQLPVGEIAVKDLAKALRCDRNIFAKIAKGEEDILPFEDFWEYLTFKKVSQGKRTFYQWRKIK